MPGALANVQVTGLVVAAGGAVYVAEAHGRDTAAGVEGAVLVYSVQGGAAEVVARVDDDRIVVEGLAVTSLGDRVIVAVAHGANNLDPAASEDSVDVYACDGSGCSAPLAVASEPGMFYESVSIAGVGDEVAVVWAQSPKAGVEAPEADFVARVGCP